MSEIAERVVILYNTLGLSANSFAKRIDVDGANFSRMVRGQQPITKRTLKKIELAFPDLNAEWLEYGRGDMMCPTVHNEQHANGDNNTQTIAPPCDVNKLINELTELRQLLQEQLQASEERTTRLLAIIDNLTK